MDGGLAEALPPSSLETLGKHSMFLKLSFHFCETVGPDAASPALSILGLWYKGLVPGTARSTREAAEVAGSGGHMGASWPGGSRTAGLKAKSKQALPGLPVWPGR